jgi:predicted TIM-barrel fold metal-dependent hydrolase
MGKIDFEAHFYTEEYLDVLRKNEGYPRFVYDDEEKSGATLHYFSDLCQPFGQPLRASLLDVGEGRLRIMDSLGVDVQMLSLSAPGIEQLSPSIGTRLARSSNDELAAVTRRHPGRYLGYAALAPKDPEAAADELERTVKEYGFVGWNTHSNYGDSYVDEKRYWPIIERAEKLGVFIYVHPTVPAIPQARTYGFALGGAPFGFGMEAALCAMRLIFSGVFDTFPRLRVMLGHLGEALPFLLKRIDWAYERPMPDVYRTLPKKPSYYLTNNIYVTTSGNYYEPAFMCASKALGMEKILLGTDYPYEDAAGAVDFIDGLSLSDSERDALYRENARRFLPTLF